jgi:hypothetical protein
MSSSHTGCRFLERTKAKSIKEPLVAKVLSMAKEVEIELM